MRRIYIFYILFSFLYVLPAFADNQLATGSKLTLSQAQQRWIAAHPEINLAFDSHFPPYSFKNEKGQYEGLAIDVFKLISKRTGLSFNNHQSGEWKTIYQSTKQQGIDVIATMVERPERLQWFNFTRPYIHKSLVIVSRNDDNTIKQRNDIADKTIALVKGYQHSDLVLKNYPAITPLFVDTLIDALNAVAVGKADASISFLAAAHHYRTKYLLSNLEYAAIYDSKTSNESIAVRKDWPELRAILDKALASITEKQMQKLRAKWLPTNSLEKLIHIDYSEAELAWLKQNQNIRIGVDPEFAPFEYIENGSYKGMASDYLKLLNQRLNLNMEVVRELSWKEVMDKIRLGEIDAVAAVGRTKEREQFLNYTLPYVGFHRVIVTRDNMPFIASLSDIEALPVAVQENTSHQGFIKENTNIQPELFPTLEASLLALSGGKVDAFIGNVASITYWIRKLNLMNLKVAAPVSSKMQTLHFATRKDWPELASILQKGLNSVSAERKKEISERWLSIDYSRAVDYTLVWQLLAAFSLLTFAFIIWARYLKQQANISSTQLAYTTTHDQLTKLPNRLSIVDTLKQKMEDAHIGDHRLALLSVDIDKFKNINDAFDHKTGDHLIQQFAERLTTISDQPEHVGRLGGDQFLIIHNKYNDIQEVKAVAERVIANVNSHFTANNHRTSITASIGIALFPDDGDTAETLLQHADTATHYAKQHLTGNYTFYTKNLIKKVSRKLQLERHLSEAFIQGEFEVHYQPKIDAKTLQIISFEALLRWSSSELGPVPPGEFIEVAERNGLIHELGIFVLEQALSTLATWQKYYSYDLSMAINLSPVQFYSANLIPKIDSLIKLYGINSKTIEFEITEGLLLSDYNQIDEDLKKLESLGVKLSVDDFGTGYSSLSYLQKYNFDTLKIDREFITGLPHSKSSQKLVAAIIAMSHELGMTVIAEGVETSPQCDFLIEHKCDVLQGWMFAKAAPKMTISQLLDAQFQATSD